MLTALHLYQKKTAAALNEIGFDGVCTIEEFRPEYYAMPHAENVKKAYQATRAYLDKYFK